MKVSRYLYIVLVIASILNAVRELPCRSGPCRWPRSQKVYTARIGNCRRKYYKPRGNTPESPLSQQTIDDEHARLEQAKRLEGIPAQ